MNILNQITVIFLQTSNRILSVHLCLISSHAGRNSSSVGISFLVAVCVQSAAKCKYGKMQNEQRQYVLCMHLIWTLPKNKRVHL